MSYPPRPMSDAQLAGLISLLSLPVVVSLMDLDFDAPAGLPSALSLALSFVHLLTLPAAAWAICYRKPRGFRSQTEQLFARFGISRARFATRYFLSRGALLFFFGYGLSVACVVLNYRVLEAMVYRELLVLLPVVLVWSYLTLAFFLAVRSWLHKLGLWLALLAYPLILKMSVPLGAARQLDPVAWTPPTRLLVSPLYHVAHLLGAFLGRADFPAGFSLAALAASLCLFFAVFLVRVPR